MSKYEKFFKPKLQVKSVANLPRTVERLKIIQRGFSLTQFVEGNNAMVCCPEDVSSQVELNDATKEEDEQDFTDRTVDL